MVWKKAAELMKILDVLTLLIKPRLRRSAVLFLSTLIPFAAVVCLSVCPRGEDEREESASGWAGSLRSVGRRENIRAGSDLPEKTRLERFKHLDALSLKQLSWTTLPGLEMLQKRQSPTRHPPTTTVSPHTHPCRESTVSHFRCQKLFSETKFSEIQQQRRRQCSHKITHMYAHTHNFSFFFA